LKSTLTPESGVPQLLVNVAITIAVAPTFRLGVGGARLAQEVAQGAGSELARQSAPGCGDKRRAAATVTDT
jgi:hypothetical protein